MNPRVLAECLVQLGRAFPNTKIGDDIGGMAQVWARVMDGLEDRFVQDAVDTWIANERFFPAPAAIRQDAIARQLGLMDENSAWLAALDLVRSSSAEDWKNADPIVVGAVRHVGGRKVLHEGTDIGWVRKSFLEAYRGLIRDVFLGRSNLVSLPTGNPMIGVRGVAIQSGVTGQEKS